MKIPHIIEKFIQKPIFKSGADQDNLQPEVNSFIVSTLIAVVDFIAVMPLRFLLLSLIYPSFQGAVSSLDQELSSNEQAINELSKISLESLKIVSSTKCGKIVVWSIVGLLVVDVLYKAVMHLSSWKATIGQRLSGVKVAKLSEKEKGGELFYGNPKAKNIVFFYFLIMASWSLPLISLYLLGKSDYILAFIVFLSYALFRDSFLLTGRKSSGVSYITGIVVIYGKAGKKFTLFDK